MARSDYTTVAIPKDLAGKMDDAIEEYDLGHRSRSEMAAEAIRIYLLLQADLIERLPED